MQAVAQVEAPQLPFALQTGVIPEQAPTFPTQVTQVLLALQ